MSSKVLLSFLSSNVNLCFPFPFQGSFISFSSMIWLLDFRLFRCLRGIWLPRTQNSWKGGRNVSCSKSRAHKFFHEQGKSDGLRSSRIASGKTTPWELESDFLVGIPVYHWIYYVEFRWAQGFEGLVIRRRERMESCTLATEFGNGGFPGIWDLEDPETMESHLGSMDE